MHGMLRQAPGGAAQQRLGHFSMAVLESYGVRRWLEATCVLCISVGKVRGSEIVDERRSNKQHHLPTTIIHKINKVNQTNMYLK